MSGLLPRSIQYIQILQLPVSLLTMVAELTNQSTDFIISY
jgi:hypothetical protein